MTQLPPSPHTNAAQPYRFDQPGSLFDTLRAEFEDSLPTLSLNKANMIEIATSLKRIVVQNHLPALVISGFWATHQWETGYNWHRKLVRPGSLNIMLGTSEFEEAGVGERVKWPPRSLRSAERQALQDNAVLLPAGHSLRQEWLVVIITNKMSAVQFGFKQPDFDQSQAENTIQACISFDPVIILRTLQVLEEVIGAYRPALLGELEQARQQFDVWKLDPKYVSLLARQAIKQARAYRQAARQLDQERAMRATLARLLHDASQPVTILTSLMELAGQAGEVLPNEIPILLQAATELSQILNRLREVNRYRTRKIDNTDFLDTGKKLF